MRIASGWALIAVLLAVSVGIGIEDKPAQPPAKGNPPAPSPAKDEAKAPAKADETKTPAAPVVVKPAPIDPAIAALVADLGSDDYQIREEAGKKLAKMGEKALPDLRRALDTSENLEVSRRLTVLVRKLDYDRLVNPKRVTLKVKDKSAKEIMDVIAKQTGYKIEYNGGGDQKYSFDFENVAFWPAMDQVATAAGLSVNPGYDDDSIHLYQQNSQSPWVSYSGPFRLVANNISTSKNIQLSNLSPNGFGNRGQEYINFSFQIFSEPKNPILGVMPVELISSEDETGASLVPPKDANNRVSHYYNQGYRSHNASGYLNLVRGAKDATTIKQMKGRVGIVLLSGTTPEIVIPDPLNIKTKKFTGRNAILDIEALTENGKGSGQYTLAVTVSKAGPNDPNHYDYSWANNAWQKMELVDDKGNKYRAQSYNHINSTPSSIQMTVPFGPDTRLPNPPKLGPPVKFVFNEWQSVTTEVTFEFKDVPLP